VTCVLPAVVLLIYWWKRGRIRLADVLPLVVWCAMAVPMGLLTAHLERVQVGAVGEDWSFTFVDRCLIAGRVVWFYVGKLLWPHPLIFFYRRWSVDAAAAWQYLFPAGVLVAIAVLWLLRRRIGRGPLVAWLIFLGALFPASGFFDVFPMRYSFVADHFQYHACMALIALFAVTLTTVLRRVVPVPRARRVASVIGTSLLLAVLGALTWRRCATYENLESLWRDTIAKNPTAWAAYNNLGNVLRHRHRPHEAVGLFERSLELRPRQIEAPINLASTLIELGHLGAALPYARQAYELAPRYALANYQLGYTLGRLNRPAEAIPYLQKAIATQPDRADWRSDYGNVLLQAGRIEEAVAQYKKALELDPDLTAAMINLGHALTRLHRYDEAIAVLQRAVALDPDNPTAKKNLESARQANAQSPQ
jgi:tetratricopeptide (TPR) repeat protein